MAALTLRRWGIMLSVRFPLEFVSVSTGYTQCFIGSFNPAKKNVWWLINTSHVLVNVSWCLKDANSIGGFGRSSFRSWPVEKDLIPIRLQFVAFYTFLQQSLPLTPSMEAFVDFLLFCLRCASMKIWCFNEAQRLALIPQMCLLK